MARRRNSKSRKETNDELSLRLHDCLSLGEVELGLSCSSVAAVGNHIGQSDILFNATDEETYRLPLLLRILKSSRPLSAIPSFTVQDTVEENDAFVEAGDAIICEAVNRLEDRAAAYSAAEGVQVVACYLAPTVAKQISRIPPLSLKKNEVVSRNDVSTLIGNLEVRYETKHLEEAWGKLGSTAINYGGSGIGKKRRRSLSFATDSNGKDDEKVAILDVSDNEMAVSNDNAKIVASRRSRPEDLCPLQSISSEDSQEYAVSKTLQELIRLTLQSLKQSPSSAESNVGTGMEDEGEGTASDANSVNVALTITMQDTILSAAARSGQHQHQSGISDLPSTVASLMHHAPCLRHRHVAVSLSYAR